MDAYSKWMLSQVERIEPDVIGPCHQVKEAADDVERKWADAGFVELPVARKSTECNPGLVFETGLWYTTLSVHLLFKRLLENSCFFEYIVRAH